MRHHPGDDIGVFLAVCETGSFVTAAALLSLTPSAVTKAINRLEQRLKVVLFTRTTRRLAITPEGVAYRDVCRNARNSIEQVETLLAALTDEPSGHLSVSVPPLLGATLITPALLSLCDEWPRLSVSISASSALADLFDGTVDLAVRVGALPDSAGLVARKLGMQRIVLCGSPAYFSHYPPPTSVEALSAHRLIGTLKNGQAAPWQFQLAGGERRQFKPETRLLLDGAQLTLCAIRAGHGLGMVPHWLVKEDIAHQRLISVLDGAISGHLPIHALWPAREMMLSRLRVAIDRLVTATHATFNHDEHG